MDIEDRMITGNYDADDDLFHDQQDELKKHVGISVII